MSEHRQVVIDFLNKCNVYAQASIERKKERRELQDIAAWESYIEFNTHAIGELEEGKLDDWFASPQAPNLPPIYRLDIASMEHAERSTWLNNILTPRPVVIAATHNEEGGRNFAPLSSVMHVSTAPAYLTASFSLHKDGRPRDTMANLRTTTRAILNILPATQDSAQLVDDTATPLPFGEDEGASINVQTVEGQPLLLNDAVAAVEVSYVEEHALPNAVAVLAVLKVEAIWFSSATLPTSGLAVLCQHGRDEMTAAPQTWTRKVSKHYG